jgi:hypothetical protein
VCHHTSAYVSIRQHTSAHVSTRQHTSAYVSIRQKLWLCANSHAKRRVLLWGGISRCWHLASAGPGSAPSRTCRLRLQEHTSAYVHIRQQTSANVSKRLHLLDKFATSVCLVKRCDLECPYADVCGRMRTYADVCGRMRTPASVYVKRCGLECP